MALALISDHYERARGKLVSQFKNQENFGKLLKVFMDEVQELEQLYMGLLLERDIPNAEGEQLDIIGEHVGVQRFGISDVDYRTKILLQIDINTSTGTESEIADIMKRITGATNLYVQDIYPAEISVFTDGGTFGSDVLNVLDKIVGATIKPDLRVAEGATPFVFDGDTTGEGFDIVGGSSGGSMVDRIEP